MTDEEIEQLLSDPGATVALAELALREERPGDETAWLLRHAAELIREGGRRN